MHLLAITTVFRTVLIILGIFVVLRVIGRMMIAKRNLDIEKELLRQQRENEKVAAETKRNFGKTSIGKVDKRSLDNAEFTDFEEVN